MYVRATFSLINLPLKLKLCIYIIAARETVIIDKKGLILFAEQKTDVDILPMEN